MRAECGVAPLDFLTFPANPALRNQRLKPFALPSGHPRIDLVEIRNGRLRERRAVQVAVGSELWRHRALRDAARGLRPPESCPPAFVRFDGFAILRRGGVGDLRALIVADSRVGVVRALGT